MLKGGSSQVYSRQARAREGNAIEFLREARSRKVEASQISALQRVGRKIKVSKMWSFPTASSVRWKMHGNPTSLQDCVVDGLHQFVVVSPKSLFEELFQNCDSSLEWEMRTAPSMCSSVLIAWATPLTRDVDAGHDRKVRCFRTEMLMRNGVFPQSRPVAIAILTRHNREVTRMQVFLHLATPAVFTATRSVRTRMISTLVVQVRGHIGTLSGPGTACMLIGTRKE
mmetsp:Transcript_28766/g.72389  ORF Transcript_28766/g.72389 Transcript_28766/m.72389 type:complete len:226 (-) Transcript_28766:406-1083(-)